MPADFVQCSGFMQSMKRRVYVEGVVVCLICFLLPQLTCIYNFSATISTHNEILCMKPGYIVFFHFSGQVICRL